MYALVRLYSSSKSACNLVCVCVCVCVCVFSRVHADVRVRVRLTGLLSNLVAYHGGAVHELALGLRRRLLRKHKQASRRAVGVVVGQE